MTTDDLKNAADRLAEARTSFDHTEKEYQRARNCRTDALNRLNEAQKAFDAAVAEVRSKAPVDSGWRRNDALATLCGDRS